MYQCPCFGITHAVADSTQITGIVRLHSQGVASAKKPPLSPGYNSSGCANCRFCGSNKNSKAA
jgi:hypothetical protein